MLTTVKQQLPEKEKTARQKYEERITRNMKKKKNVKKNSYFIKRKKNGNVNISSTRHTHAKILKA
jgi:hypothetical protein